MGLKVNLGNTKVIVSRSITKDVMSKSKVDPCRVCSMRVMCVQCGKWINGRCAGIIRVTPRSSRNLPAENVKGIMERQWSRK